MIVANGKDGATRRKESTKRISSAALIALLERQEYRCALTGRALTPAVASVDHTVPLGSGGLNVIDNIQIVVAEVNQAKGSMSQEAFIQMCRDVVAWIDKE